MPNDPSQFFLGGKSPAPTVAHTLSQVSETELEAEPAFSSQIWVCEQAETPSHPLKCAGAKMGI